jgi:hypothetical protein
MLGGEVVEDDEDFARQRQSVGCRSCRGFGLLLTRIVWTYTFVTLVPMPR